MDADTKRTLAEYAPTAARLKASSLIGQYGFTRSDRDDIEQELILAVLTRLEHFDPATAGITTFVRVVIERGACSLIRRQMALRRDYRRQKGSLSDLADDTGPAKANGCPSNAGYDDREQRELALEVREALAGLPDELRAIAEDLRNGYARAAIARRHGITRDAVRWKVRIICRRLEQQGFAADFNNHNGAPSRK